jgi:HSP20 family molecular chaperone IbpA
MTETNTLQPQAKRELEGEGTRPGPVFRPDVDILERKDAFVVYADLPGADDKSIDVRLDRGTLTLDAQLAVFPESDWRPLHTEYRSGSYHREFRISEDIDANRVSATMRGGVLELLLPKSAARQPRSIQVQSG